MSFERRPRDPAPGASGEARVGSRPAGLPLLAIPLLLGLPLIGVLLAGGEVPPYLEFPPRTRRADHPGFSPVVFTLMAVFVLACVTPFLRVVLRGRTPGSTTVAPARLPAGGRFPAWGWLGLAAVAGGWLAAWTRLPALAPVQLYTFFPLWLGYIVTMNALLLARTGRCPLTATPRAYATLALVSAAFWWFFEYLNRFVQNWYYVGIEHFGPAQYAFWSSLAFATVLPAVSVTEAWVRSFPRVHAGLAHGLAIAPARPRALAFVTLAAAALGLLAIGVRPALTFPLLWLAPLALIVALQALAGQAHALSPVARGDWRPVWTWSLAALLCGVCWETWNAWSAAKWIYTVPWVHRYEIFEMPLLGFAGYLPFGLECAVATAWCAGLAGGAASADLRRSER